MTKAPGHVIDMVFVHPEAKALDMLPIIVLACANGLQSIRGVRVGDSILLIAGVCDLEVQVSIYLGACEREEVRRHSLKGEEVFAANLEHVLLALGGQEDRESLHAQLSASVFPKVDPGDTICPLVSS